MRLDRVGSGLDEVSARKTRRRWSVIEKRRIVEETLRPGSSVAEVALTNSVIANQVHSWRRQYERGRLLTTVATGTLVPVRLIESHEVVGGSPVKAAQQVPHPPIGPRRPRSAGIIQIELERGRLRVEGVADPAALRLVLEYLLR